MCPLPPLTPWRHFLACTRASARARASPIPPLRAPRRPPPLHAALGVAVGSSIQIALFAIPFVVVVGWATGRPFSLDLDPFATLALTVSVIHANFVTAGASSHWLMGVQLIATYCLIALTFLYR
jgi:hypothetical protein